MLLEHDEIVELLEIGVVEYTDLELVNGSSLDVRLGMTIQIERPPATTTEEYLRDGTKLQEVVLKDRTPINTIMHSLKDQGPFKLYPGEFILAHTHEVFHIPNHISATYRLKSSMARIGLEHLNAGWCDPGWNNSCLTLELKNMTRHHVIVLNYLDKIGQMCFYRHKQVSPKDSYSVKGRYNGDRTVSGSKPDPVAEPFGSIISGDDEEE